MKVELGLKAPVEPRSMPPWGRMLLAPLLRLPSRLRDRRFWEIQLLVLVAAAPHYAIELSGFNRPLETLDGLTITLNVIPLLYAAINFGWEGAFLTGLMISALTSPGMVLWHHSTYHWVGEVGQFVVALPMGLLVAWRVDIEARQRQRAEETSARLALLNEVSERLGRRLEVEPALPGVVEQLREGLAVEAVWLCLESEAPAGEVQVIGTAPGREQAPQEVHRLAAATCDPVRIEARLLVIPLLTETGVLGSLGALASQGQALSEEQATFLGTAAHEIRVAVENDRLYRQRQESLESYARQVTQAQEEERLRIARELHDETAQELVHLVRKLEQLGEAADSELAGRIDELLKLSRQTLQSVRRFSRDLRPSVLDDLGLLPAIELAVEETDGRLQGGAHLVLTGSARRLSPPVELALFRIAQESLHNVERHAAEAAATVEVEFSPGSVRLVVSDDGGGCDLPANVSNLARAGKLGVLGMKDRAELVGGSFELDSAPGKGCRVSVEVNDAAAVGVTA